MSVRGDTWRTRRFVPFLPFLFLGVVFVGHGPLALVLSLLVSVTLTAGVSFLLLRGRARRDGEESAAGAFIASASSAGLQGILQLDAAGIHWMPRRAQLPLWFIPWGDVVGTKVQPAATGSDLVVELAGGEALTLTVDATVTELERALGRAHVA